jgi:protein FAM32A
MKKEGNNQLQKFNFVGGKLKIKSTKSEMTVYPSLNKLKKFVAQEQKLISKNEKKKSYEEEISAFVNDDESNYLRKLERNIEEDTKESNNLLEDMTSAERLYYQRKLNRLPEKIKKGLHMTYKQKYENFNKALSKLPEHYDIPKVGPG